MKKILQNVLFVLIVAFGFMLVSTNVYAEEVGEITPPNTGVSTGHDNLLLLLSLVTAWTVGFALTKKN